MSTRRLRSWRPHSRASRRTSISAYNAACAYALASQALGRKDQTKSKPLADRAIGLLKAAIASGYSDFNHMQEDADLDPIRGLPEFGEIMKAGHVDRAYAAVWMGDAGLEANPVVGLDPDDHLKRMPRAGVSGLSHGLVIRCADLA